MAPMVSTTRATTWPPLTATSEAEAASRLAWWAWSALRWAVPVSSAIALAVCSRAPACCSVRADRLALPWEIWTELEAIASVPARTWPTIRTRLPFMSLRARSSCPVSSLATASMSLVKSPEATVWATPTAQRSWRDRARATTTAKARVTARPTRPSAMPAWTAWSAAPVASPMVPTKRALASSRRASKSLR